MTRELELAIYEGALVRPQRVCAVATADGRQVGTAYAFRQVPHGRDWKLYCTADLDIDPANESIFVDEFPVIG